MTTPARTYGEVGTIGHLIPSKSQAEVRALGAFPDCYRRVAERWLMIGLGVNPERSRVDYGTLQVIETLDDGQATGIGDWLNERHPDYAP